MYGASSLRHRFIFGRGMVSDDTEHACMLAQSLLAAPDEPREFARSLARRFRFWLLGLPAGVGWGTLRAIMKLWLGVSPSRSGVWSAGNGPAMRSPMLGVCLPGVPETLASFVKASTRLTHSDPRAEQGALAVAVAASFAARCEGGELDAAEALAELRERLSDDELLRALERVGWHLERKSSPASLADEMGLANGVTGYVYHTVPIALFCWLRSPGDFRQAVTDVVSLGGDTDTTAAIVGALAGATVGASRMPEEWTEGLVEWPRSVPWMKRLASRLARACPENGSGTSSGPLALFWPALVPRNVFFLAIVLAHGFRRLLPPY